MVKAADSSDEVTDPQAVGDGKNGGEDNAAETEDQQRPSTTGISAVRKMRPKGTRRAAPLAPPRPGALTPKRVVGRCEIFSEIAEGELASVYVGRLIGVGGFARTVAIKVMHEEYAKDPAFRQKFLDEAAVVSRIRHPNVVPTLDLVEEGDELFIVMEYVEGDTFSHLMSPPGQLAVGAPPPLGVALNIVAATLHGLHSAHEACDAQGEAMGLVHRDVNPHNILVGTDGYARLMDFGVARALGQTQATKAGQIHGEPGYLAPEQIRSEPIDARADVFATSVVLWRALTGQRLFDGKHPLDVANEVLNKDIEPPSVHQSKVPSELDAIVLRGLERDRDKRWPTALAMAEAIDALKLSASHREVGTWVRRAAAAELRRRGSLIAQLERAPIDEAAMERKSTLPVYRMPRDGAGSVVPAPTRADETPSEPPDDDDVPLDEATFTENGETESADGAAPAAAVAKPEPASPDRPSPPQPQRAAGAKKRAAPPAPARQLTGRHVLWVGGGSLAVGVIVALIALTGDDDSQPQQPTPTGQPTLSETPAPAPSPAAPVLSTAEPIPTTTPTATPTVSASATAPPTTATPGPTTTTPPGPSLYGRE